MLLKKYNKANNKNRLSLTAQTVAKWEQEDELLTLPSFPNSYFDDASDAPREEQRL